MHSELPVVSALYLPARHAVQPAEVEAPDSALKEPAKHAVQTEALGKELYVVMAQAVHTADVLAPVTLP